MKKFKISKIIVLLLSIALLMGSVVAVTASADNESTGKFGSITLAYSDKVAIMVKVNATQEELENGTVVVNYVVEGINEDNPATAEYYKTDDKGQCWVITSGFSPFEFTKIVTFSSSVNGTQVESGRTYSVAQFLYKKLYTDSNVTEEFRTLYESLIAYGNAAQIAYNQKDFLITNSTIAYSQNGDVKFDGKSTAFAPGRQLENLTPTWKGSVPAGKEVSGWVIVENGETKIVDTTFNCSGNVEIVEPIFTIKNVPPYTLVNGDFADGLNGWTLINTNGDAPFGGIDNKTTFWDQNYPMFNVGEYFSAYADGAVEASQGRLESSFFTVGSQYATYMLGGAGNDNVYITIENKADDVLALYTNTMFKDFVEGNGTIGEDVFLANFVTYKVDLSAWMGEEVRFVVHDYASENWGVVFFDEVITYYTETDALPENAVLAKNLLADKSALEAEIALEVSEQGDYTADSYNEYLAKLAAAKALVEPVNAKQDAVDAATADLTAARLALAVREITENPDANKSFAMVSGKTMEINISDYVNTNGLSNITYSAKVGGQDVAVNDGLFTVVAGDAGALAVEFTVYYKNEAKLTVKISVEVTNDVAPVVESESVETNVDLYFAENKNNITINFADNVNNKGDLALTYTVKLNGETIALDGTSYTFAFGQYTETVVTETFTVTVSYVANGEAGTIEYTYTLAINDTTAYRVVNGGFETGNLEGWIEEVAHGKVTNADRFFNGREYGKAGTYLYSGVQDQGGEFLEGRQGVLTSSPFKIGGTGYITFMLGGGGNERCYVQIVDAVTGEVLARYHQQAMDEAVLITYVANLNAFYGKTVKFQIVDFATNDWGCVSFDNLVTYYTTIPEGITANDIKGDLKYTIENGSFETGNMDGWSMNVTEHGAHGTLGWVLSEEDNQGWYAKNDETKDGDYLFTFLKPSDINCESTKGTLTSSTFTLKKGSYISFKFGGAGNAKNHDVWIELCRANGEVIARFYNDAEGKIHTKMNSYFYQYNGETSDCFIRVVDNSTGDYGCFVVDDFRVNLESAPEGYIAAILQ